MIVHLGEVLAAVFAAFLAGSVLGWLLYRLVDRTRLALGQRAVSDAIGRFLRLSPPRASAAVLPGYAADAQRALVPAEIQAGRLQRTVKQSTRATAWTEARDERLARDIVPVVTASEALAVAKTATMPAVTIPVPERDAIKLRGAKVGDVWTLGEKEEVPRPVIARPARIATPARRKPVADDPWDAPGADWPIGFGAKLLPAPQRIAEGARPVALRIGSSPPVAKPLMLPYMAPSADDIWSDEPARPRIASRPRRAAPIDDIVAEIAGDIPAPANGQRKLAPPSARAVVAKVPEFRLPGDAFSRTLADAADKAWDKAGARGDGEGIAARAVRPARKEPLPTAIPEPRRLPRAALPRPIPRLAPPAPVHADGSAKPFLFSKPPGRRDNLRRIRGVGHSFEHRLHDIGIYQLVQIANWSAAEQAWVSAALNAPGKVEAEDWTSQAAELLAVRRGVRSAQS